MRSVCMLSAIWLVVMLFCGCSDMAVSEEMVIERPVETTAEKTIPATVAIEKTEEEVLVSEALADSFRIVESADGRIRMIMRPEDVQASGISEESLQAWVDLLAVFREDIKWLVGGVEPYDGITVFNMTETFDYYGLAGDPILMNQSFVEMDLALIHLAETPGESQVLWPYVHELSHTFDGIGASAIDGGWNFDGEFFADLKMAYALGKNDYGMGDGFYGDDIIRAFEDMNTLPNRVYSNDGLVYTLLTTLDMYEQDPWEQIHQVFVMISEEEVQPETETEKFRAFWDGLCEVYGERIELKLDPVAWECLVEKYEYESKGTVPFDSITSK